MESLSTGAWVASACRASVAAFDRGWIVTAAGEGAARAESAADSNPRTACHLNGPHVTSSIIGVIVGGVGVYDLAHRLVVEVLDDVVAEEAAASDDAMPDPGFLQRLDDAAPVDVERGRRRRGPLPSVSLENFVTLRVSRAVRSRAFFNFNSYVDISQSPPRKR